MRISCQSAGGDAHPRQEASALDDTLGVLPHWARSQVRALAGELEDLLAHVGRESPVLAPLREEEVLADDANAAAPAAPTP